MKKLLFIIAITLFLESNCIDISLNANTQIRIDISSLNSEQIAKIKSDIAETQNLLKQEMKKDAIYSLCATLTTGMSFTASTFFLNTKDIKKAFLATIISGISFGFLLHKLPDIVFNRFKANEHDDVAIILNALPKNQNALPNDKNQQ